MERDQGKIIPRISFIDHFILVKKLCNSGKITKEREINTTAAFAIEDLLLLEQGTFVEGAGLAVNFLAKNWHIIPEEIKVRRGQLK